MIVKQRKPNPENIISSAFMLISSVLAAGILGVTTFVLLENAIPSLPRWAFLLIAVLVVAAVLLVLQKQIKVLQNWIYLLPAAVFLIGFTCYPLAMTLYFAFTNYSAVNSGRPDSSTQLQIKRASGNSVLVLDATDLNRLHCAASDCAGEKLELRDATQATQVGATFTVARASGLEIIFQDNLPAGFEPSLLRRMSVVNWIGFENFRTIFANVRRELAPVLGWNVFFALFTTIFNVFAGVTLGVLLHNKRLRFRNVYRSILFLPWAIPAVISIQMWQTLFNTNFGAMNRLLGLFGFLPAPWLDHPLWAKAAILLVNLWLSFPFFMTATLGALTTIPEELYEAAEVDGATPWQRFRFITLPLIQMPFTPIVLSSFAASFNNINLIYLLTAGGPVEEGRLPNAQSTDILLSWGYKTAFQSGTGQNYGLASAIAVVVGIITVSISLFNFQFSGVFKDTSVSDDKPIFTRASRFPRIGTWLGWIALTAFVGTLVWAGLGLAGSLKPKSFAILYPVSGPEMVLLGLLAVIAVVAGIAYITHRIALRKNSRVSYVNILSTQLTHGFFWLVILGTIYPIIYVLSASFDPLNRLTQASLGTSAEPLLTRARVIPSLEGLDFSNYAKLLDGVVIPSWQLLGLGLVVLSALFWLFNQFLVSQNPTRAAESRSRIAAWVTLLGVAALILSLSPAQFTSANPSSKFLLWIRNTLLISGSTGLITMIVTTIAGYALARLRFFGRMGFLQTIIFLQMFPGLLGLVATYSLINYLGLVNTFSGLILAYSGGVISFGIWVFKGYVETLPASLDEAALVDGCTRWQAFLRIILPLSAPALVFIFLLQFIGTYTEFFLANVIVTGAENWNVGVGLRSFTAGQFTVSYGPFAAAAVLGALPIVILFYSFQKVFVSGLASGSVKG